MLSYIVFILAIAAIYALLAQSLVPIWGQTGMVNLGLVGFFAIGAYTSALLTTDFGWPAFTGPIMGLIAGGLLGLAVTFSTLRLRDDYLAIVTLGFAEVVRIVASNEIWLTGGTDGIAGIPALFDRDGGLMYHVQFLVLATVICIVTGLIITRLVKSPWGRVLRAVRDDQVVASVAGKKVVVFKIQAFVLGASIAGMAGALYGSYISYISPDLFLPLITIYVFLAATAGGNTRALGATVGAYLLVAWLEISRFAGEILPMLSAVQIASVREMIVGLALIVVLRFAPGGLFKEKSQKAPA
ncbi:branched-chain amino acid ABC transporter permease [Pelagibacterium flavum]|uniref:Branched-chain amino acid ABC transporter permease n=1 Tax=Pelagibacterium flavum TaxID=2984530 RepID=A0ABY6ITG1_9HYPH|nr:branched-chain amino acid ABC transporter permease [Pelagibacterium sp. YIM 151497]UYQ73868.1 branched-chain amino acid ABC transporter permease [Pelagibacterium sp. YIM 151497]